MATKTKKRRYTLAERQAMAHESLSRATGRETATNYPAIFAGFEAKGIDPDDIKPRVNVFTYRAWLALGRQVRKGEHGVKVITIVPCKAKGVDGKPELDKNGNPKTFGRKSRATVFHVSQTDAIDGAEVPPGWAGCEESEAAPAVVPSIPQPYAERAADQYAGWSGHQESEAKPAGMLF